MQRAPPCANCFGRPRRTDRANSARSCCLSEYGGVPRSALVATPQKRGQKAQHPRSSRPDETSPSQPCNFPRPLQRPRPPLLGMVARRAQSSLYLWRSAQAADADVVAGVQRPAGWLWLLTRVRWGIQPRSRNAEGRAGAFSTESSTYLRGLCLDQP